MKSYTDKDLIHNVVPSIMVLAKQAFTIASSTSFSDTDFSLPNPSLCLEKSLEIGNIQYKKLCRTATVQRIKDVLLPDIFLTLPQDRQEDVGQELSDFCVSMHQKGQTDCGRMLECVCQLVLAVHGYILESQQTSRSILKNARCPLYPHPDFLLPSAKYFICHPEDCIFLECKSTLRERWSQVINRGTQVFLMTTDQKVTKAKIQAQKDNGVIMVVPQILKQSFYRNFDNVIDLEEFFAKHLDPAFTKWAERGVVMAHGQACKYSDFESHVHQLSENIFAENV